MTRRAILLFVPPTDPQALAQVAAAVLALSKLPWRRWEPSLYVTSRDDRLAAALRAFWPYRSAMRDAPAAGPTGPCYAFAEMGALFEDADVIVKLAADTFAVSDFEDVLDQVETAGGIAGVMAYQGFPGWPDLAPREAWARLTAGVTSAPLQFAHAHPLRDPAASEAGRRTPFYPDNGAVFFAGRSFPQFIAQYGKLLPAVLDRLPVLQFADGVTIALAAAESGVSALALPLRFDFPIDAAAAIRYPAELQDVRIFHHSRTDETGQAIFATAERYMAFTRNRLTGVHERFRAQVAEIAGANYPFEQDCPAHQGPSGPFLPASPSVTGCRHFDYAPGQPNLYRLMRLKQALVTEFGVQRGFAVYRQTVNLRGSEQLVRKPLVPAVNFATSRARDFFPLAPAAEPFLLEPPAIIGAGNHRPLQGVTRSHYLACLADARVRGRSGVVEAGDAVLLDCQDAEAALLDDEREWDPAIFTASREMGWIAVPPDDAASLQLDAAFMLTGAHTDFFGHWMCEYLPKYVAARLSGQLPAVPVMIDASMPRNHRQALEFLFAGEIELIEVPAFRIVLVRRLWYAPSLSYWPLHEKRNKRFNWDVMAAPPDRFVPVITEMTRRAHLRLGPQAGDGRVFLARKDFRHRRLVNRQSIEAQAEARGFRIVYPEDLDFADQVAAARTARYLLATEGSALFLVFFCQAGTKLGVLSHPLTDGLADYNGIFRPHRIEMTVLTGPVTWPDPQTPHDSDYEIGEQAFAHFLDRWLAA